MARDNETTIAHFFKVFRLLLLLASFSACRLDSKNKVDEFYTEKGEWDSARIPFLKPFEAIIVGKKYGWFMNLITMEDGNSMLSHIKKATVYCSPVDDYQKYFHLVQDKITKNYDTHFFIPYSILSKRVSSLFIAGAEIKDNVGASIFQALFTFEELTKYVTFGDVSYE